MKTTIKARKKRIPSWDELREFRDKEILAAVAAINYDRDAAIYAHEQGLLVISTTDGDNFTLEPSERKKLKRF